MPAGVPWLPVLYSRWGLPEPPGVSDLLAYSRLRADGPAGLLFQEWDDSEFVLLPFDWSHTQTSRAARETAHELARGARRSGKRLLVFYTADDERPFSFPRAVIFRTSLRKDRSYWRTTFAMPGWLQDPLEVAPKHLAQSLTKEERPTIGFCGLTAPVGAHRPRFRRFRRSLKSFAHSLKLARLPDLTPTMLRRTALDVFAADPRLKTNFIERSQFFAGAALPDGTYDLRKRERVRSEYVGNILAPATHSASAVRATSHTDILTRLQRAESRCSWIQTAAFHSTSRSIGEPAGQWFPQHT